MAEQILDADYAAFARKVKPVIGVDLAGYKVDQMRRRLIALAGRYGASTLTAFAEVMQRNPEALAAFKDFFTINVSEFLRDGPRWDDLAKRILPDLIEGTGGRPLQIWSAGCSIGAEPYSLAMLLEELAPGRTHTITATDIDQTILTRAQGGRTYTEADLRGVNAARRERYFNKEADGSYAVKPLLKPRIRFRRQDLLADPAPAQELDLIVCRNVVIYFTEEAKRGIYTRFFEALRPGGVLFVGGTEFVTGARELGLEQVGTSFYRRPRARLAGVA